MGNLNLWRNNWNPWREAMALSKAFDNMLEEFPVNRSMGSDVSKFDFSPSCEVHEDKNSYLLKMDLPGVAKENVKIDINENRLTISGERKEEKKTEDKDTKTHFSEVYYGSFMRSMTFPTAVDAERCEAKFEGGVLRLTISKKTTPNSRQITIK